MENVLHETLEPFVSRRSLADLLSASQLCTLQWFAGLFSPAPSVNDPQAFVVVVANTCYDSCSNDRLVVHIYWPLFDADSARGRMV